MERRSRQGGKISQQELDRLVASVGGASDREDDVGYPAAIHVQSGYIDSAVVAKYAVKRMNGLAGGAGDYGLMQRRVAIGDDGVAPVVSVDLSAGFARAAQVERLAVG